MRRYHILWERRYRDWHHIIWNHRDFSCQFSSVNYSVFQDHNEIVLNQIYISNHCALQAFCVFAKSGFTISKDTMLRRSDWSRPLSPRQLRYAATDAAVSLFVFHELVNELHFTMCDTFMCSFYFIVPCACESMQMLFEKLMECFEIKSWKLFFCWLYYLFRLYFLIMSKIDCRFLLCGKRVLCQSFRHLIQFSVCRCCHRSFVLRMYGIYYFKSWFYIHSDVVQNCRAICLEMGMFFIYFRINLIAVDGTDYALFQFRLF